MKALRLLIFLFMVPVIHGNGDSNNALELTTFFDAASGNAGNAGVTPRKNKKMNLSKPLKIPPCEPLKITPWDFESHYNMGYLRKIIHKTEQDSTPPEESLEYFKEFLKYGSYYITLSSLVEQKVEKFVQDPKKVPLVKSLLRDYVSLAILLDQQEDYMKSLNRNREATALLLSKIQKKTEQVDESAA